MKLYWGIGFYIAIVVRTSLLQDLPFPQIVWKAIAGEQVGREDVLEADPTLAELVGTQATWTCTNWDGSVVALPGHDPAAAVDQREVYTMEVVKFRLNALIPFLIQMREGFCQNASLPKDVGLTGKLLEHLAQGAAEVTVEQLRTISQTDQVPGIERLWRVLERFTPDQRKLFLKFATGQTKLPGPSYAGTFSLHITSLGRVSDQRLPMASTCFNVFRWPEYSSDEIAAERLDYAIRNCQAMALG